MEPTQSPLAGFRYRLVGPKFQVVKVEKGKTGIRIHMKYEAIGMVWDCPVTNADVRIGDLLTLYTEVLVDANAGPAPFEPIQ